MWRSLVNVDLIKTAVRKLTETNWLYKGLDDNSVDEAAKQVIKVTNNTSSTMVEKLVQTILLSFKPTRSEA